MVKSTITFAGRNLMSGIGRESIHTINYSWVSFNKIIQEIAKESNAVFVFLTMNPRPNNEATARPTGNVTLRRISTFC